MLIPNVKSVTRIGVTSLLLAALSAQAEPVDINIASAESLSQNIMGVGPVLASAIVAYRQTYGAFSSAVGLLDVRGIGTKILQDNAKTILVDGKAFEN